MTLRWFGDVSTGPDHLERSEGRVGRVSHLRPVGERLPEPLDRLGRDGLPGARTGIPGGYGATTSADTRPTASLAETVRWGAKKASRGDITTRGSTVQEIDGRTFRGAARWRSIEATSAVAKRSTVCWSSLIVMIGITVSRSANSIGVPAARRSSSSARPLVPVPETLMASFARSRLHRAVDDVVEQDLEPAHAAQSLAGVVDDPEQVPEQPFTVLARGALARRPRSRRTWCPTGWWCSRLERAVEPVGVDARLVRASTSADCV